MQRAGDQLLARAGLTRDQHGHARPRKPADGTEHLLHGRRLADDRRQALRFSGGVRLAATIAPRGLVHELYGLVDVERLGQVFKRAALVGGDGILEIGVRRDNDDRQVRARGMQALEQRDAAHARHAHVGDQHVRLTVGDGFEQMLGALEPARLHVRLPQRLLEHPAHRLVVVDDPDIERPVVHASAPFWSSGMRTKNIVRPGRLSNSMRPPWRLSNS